MSFKFSFSLLLFSPPSCFLNQISLLPRRTADSPLVAAGPGSRCHQLPKSILFPWTVYLSIPLLTVQTHLYALAKEETRPHDDVEHRPLAFVIHCKVEHHSKHCKEAEHDGVEESQTYGQGVLMDDSRDNEHQKHGSCSEFPL